MSGRAAVRTLALAIAAGACSDVPDDTLDTDRPLTSEFVEVFRVGDMDPPDWAQFGTPPRLGFDGRGNLGRVARSNPSVPPSDRCRSARVNSAGIAVVALFSNPLLHPQSRGAADGRSRGMETLVHMKYAEVDIPHAGTGSASVVPLHPPRSSDQSWTDSIPSSSAIDPRM